MLMVGTGAPSDDAMLMAIKITTIWRMLQVCGLAQTPQIMQMQSPKPVRTSSELGSEPNL